jgi:hypothetical protein
MLYLDETHHPIVVWTFDGALTDEEVSLLIERFEATADRGQRMVYVVDATRADWLTAPQRQRIEAMMKRRRAFTGRYCCGIAMVMSRSVPRVMLRALLTVAPLSVPHGVWARFDDAVRWAYQRLREHGITPPLGPIHPRGALSYPPTARAG